LFHETTGFFRPIVSLSFAADEALFGIRPLPYGLTNLVLLLLAALAVGALGRAIGLSAFGAALAAGLWALNPHGINMSLLWVSGRTAILVALFAALAATAFVRGRTGLAALCTLLALLSKEEAIALPAVLFAWALVLPPDGSTVERFATRLRLALLRAWPLILPVAVYLALRSRSTAYTPWSAPSFYRFSFDGLLILRNVGEYLDRGATFAVAAALLVTLASRRRPALRRDDTRRVLLGAVWLVGGYILTVFLPVRSSLYALSPSIGAALGAATWVDRLAVERPGSGPQRVTTTLAIVALLSIPIYWQRNGRWAAEGELSTLVLSALERETHAIPPDGTVVIRDESGTTRVASVFGMALPEAVRLATGRADIHVWVDPPPPGWESAGWARPRPQDVDLELAVRDRRIIRVR
jgi:hypothetical protein